MDSIFDIEHSYYMSSGNFYSNDSHSEYEDFSCFLEEWGELDIDYNRVHRWDIIKRDPDDYSDDDDQYDGYILEVYYVMQRKASLFSVCIRVTRYDEKRIIKFLKPHSKYNSNLWDGI